MATIDVVIFDVSKLEARRRAALLTQGELARKVGCCWRTIFRARQAAPIGLGTAKRIAAALDVPLRDLLPDGVTGAVGVSGVADRARREAMRREAGLNVAGDLYD